MNTVRKRKVGLLPGVGLMARRVAASHDADVTGARNLFYGT
jgi:hypothetical protein